MKKIYLYFTLLGMTSLQASERRSQRVLDLASVFSDTPQEKLEIEIRLDALHVDLEDDFVGAASREEWRSSFESIGVALLRSDTKNTISAERLALVVRQYNSIAHVFNERLGGLEEPVEIISERE